MDGSGLEFKFNRPDLDEVNESDLDRWTRISGYLCTTGKINNFDVNDI